MEVGGIRCLLHERSTITEMRTDLVDSRTGTAIEFSGNRPFELTFLIEFVPFFAPGPRQSKRVLCRVK